MKVILQMKHQPPKWDIKLSDLEWNFIKQLVILLHPLARVTELFSGSSYPTLGEVFPQLKLMSKHYGKIPIMFSNSNSFFYS